MKHIIGLDLGTNSIGWALILQDDAEQIQIIKTGVHIFPIGTNVDPKSQKETTKNEQRRIYRGASRNRYRFKLRREILKLELDKNGMLPDYKELFKQKGHKQSYELYKLRSNALKQKIDLTDIGRIFLLLNKYRGFESNSKKIQQEDEETGKVKKGISELEGYIFESGAETIGEYFFFKHKEARALYTQKRWHNDNEPIDDRAKNKETGEIVLFNSNGIRRHFGRYTARFMYKIEFDKIWAEQMKYHAELKSGSPREYQEIKELPYKEKIEALKKFKETLYWKIREYCIYYQRPLKSQKKYVSNCTFENGNYFTKSITKGEKNVLQTIYTKRAKKVIPKSHPLYQEFRIYKKLNQISYSSDTTGKSLLKKEWITILANYLQINPKLLLNEPKKRKAEEKSKSFHQLLSLPPEYKFFVDKVDKEAEEEKTNVNEITGNEIISTFYQILSEEKFLELKSLKEIKGKKGTKLFDENYGKLELLWHHLYISKNGLMPEEEWIKGILTEPTKWNFTKEQAAQLYEVNIEPDYGSFSAKVIKQILPLMREGKNESEALTECPSGYMKSESEKSQNGQLKEKITQLKYQELRNPVVERAVSQAIKIVNAILEKYRTEIDRENFEIRIESTRQFKKPRQERESERRKNNEKDKLRQYYADELNKRKDKTGIKRNIYKYDDIIGKYELWLEMGYEKEFNDEEFQDFIKLKKEAQEKHRLWLECNRMCPYTGTPIPLHKLFSSEIEIEHIIPMSRSLDNSFNNKTLTYSHTNKLKGKRTSYEFMKDDLKNFKKIIESAHFSDSKLELFLNSNISADFSNNQIPNTSYIAKFTKKKMLEVCRKIYFTNGHATSELRNNDWRLSSLLDKIRYMEDFNIEMDKIYNNFYRLEEDYFLWRNKKGKSADYKLDWKNIQEDKDIIEYEEETKNDLRGLRDEITKFNNNFRSKEGKKDRSDHRHHAIDAVITACCNNKTIQTLSTLNALKEEHPKQYKFRDKIEKPFDYNELKNSISSILVSHLEKQILIKKRNNRIKNKSGIIEQVTYAPQGSLHKETFYGKLKEPLNHGIDKQNAFISRSRLVSKVGSAESYLFENESGIESIYEPNIQKIINDRLNLIDLPKDEKGKNLKPFSEKTMAKLPIMAPSINKDGISKKGKPTPIIKSVRTKYKNENSLIKLNIRDENGEIIENKLNRKYADKDGSHLMVLYEKKQFDKKGIPKKTVRKFSLLSFWDAIEKKRNSSKLFSDELNEVGLLPECQWLKKGDIILMYEIDEDKQKIEWENHIELSKKLYRINEIGVETKADGKQYAVIKMEPHKLMKKKEDKYLAEGKFLKRSQSIAAIKVRLDCLGNIIAKGEECF